MSEQIQEALGRVPIVRVARPVQFPAGRGAGQRAARRRRLASVIEVREAGTRQEPLPLELDEVSATGGFIRSALLLPVGTDVDIVFELPDTTTTTAGSVHASAKVVRVEAVEGRPGMGIHFRRMPPVARAAIRAYTSWS